MPQDNTFLYLVGWLLVNLVNPSNSEFKTGNAFHKRKRSKLLDAPLFHAISEASLRTGSFPAHYPGRIIWPYFTCLQDGVKGLLGALQRPAQYAWKAAYFSRARFCFFKGQVFRFIQKPWSIDFSKEFRQWACTAGQKPWQPPRR